MYKYSCRKCPIRNRCIRESKYTTSVKNMIESAFEARTDTLSTWGLLQANCLLIKAEEEQERKARQESTLRRRLREAREAKRQAAADVRTQKSGGETDPLIRRLPQAEARRKARETDDLAQAQSAAAQPKETSELPSYLQSVSSSVSGFSSDVLPETIRDQAGPAGSPGTKETSKKPSKPCWLTVKGSGRHIMLPADGELTLGRFDAAFGIPPDIDLAYEDGDHRTVSRRHVKISGVNGSHTIEDTGSRYGVVINGDKISPGRPQRLTPGDRVAIGNVQMFYDQIPEYMQVIPSQTAVRHVLIVTPTGRKLTITPSRDIIIGRSDRYVDFVPEIDLSQDGEAASRVSRRHAIIHWHKDKPYLEDLGSGFGTRLNGQMLLLGQAVPLKAGDHIWLGGCVLAYDVEL